MLLTQSLLSLYLEQLEPVLPWTISKSLCNGVSRVRKGDKDVHWLRDELLLEAEVSHTQKNVIVLVMRSNE